ncbi:apolipoprotein D and lipocalin family protein [Azotobacter beijerinckii]|uniref:Outer membrane lipoprotein Blc n=2 Tax=Azotobacter beijerinckii TaxID=170623 RepID=A0A1H9DNN5_9GAMM|nr:apolipoprotein D and lipocalin family protein [Azotobacter beijerinckii]SEJ08314.1 apolipoprotein D and lipocalin family protein [Azotobacter beijerinckii]SEQ15094.1 apolipoprotein D and lipocalin family protein [Azotobacter beijerinckii]
MPMRRIQRCLAIALFCACPLATLADDRPLTTIAALDLPSYMGTWYEIARYPNRFQKQCAGFTRADYSLMPDGQVRVINRCRLQSGETEIAIGTARQLGGARSPKFEVSFAPAWISLIPAVWGDYWVIDLDEQHQLVAVSEPRREYLWVLSRTPQVERQAYEALLERLSRKGFDLGKLMVTRQE